MDNESKLNSKLRLHSELKSELELSKNMARHYLNIEAYDFLLSTATKLVSAENQLRELALEIKELREVIEQEIKEIL